MSNGLRFGCVAGRIGKNKKGKSKMKISLMLLSACCLAAAITGCKSIEVDRRGHQVALDGDGQVIKDKDGNPVVIDMGWEVDYFQHWNWQRFDQMHAKAGEAELDINGYEGGAAASNLTALVSTSLSGVATITEKVVAAIITYGGSVAAEGGSAAIAALANKFIANGGQADAAKVEVCKDGSCTITDGCTTCTEQGCADCAPATK